jgi:hypothetical protein
MSRPWYGWMVLAWTVLAGGARADEARAVAALGRLGATIQRDENQPGKNIIFENIKATSIRLPPAIKDAVEHKIEQQHLAEAYVYRLEREKQEVERKKIEAAGNRAYNETIEPSLTPAVLRWKGIEAMRDLAASPNAKVVVVGNGRDGIPVMLEGGPLPVARPPASGSDEVGLSRTMAPPRTSSARDATPLPRSPLSDRVNQH